MANQQSSLELFEQALTTKGGIAIHAQDPTLLKSVRWRLYAIRRYERNVNKRAYHKHMGESRFDELTVSLQPSIHGWTLRIFKETEILDNPDVRIEYGGGTRL